MPASEVKDNKSSKKNERQVMALKKRISKTTDLLKTLQDKLKSIDIIVQEETKENVQ